MGNAIFTRMGDGERIQIDKDELKQELLDGTRDAAKKGKIPELGESDLDQLNEALQPVVGLDDFDTELGGSRGRSRGTGWTCPGCIGRRCIGPRMRAQSSMAVIGSTCGGTRLCGPRT